MMHLLGLDNPGGPWYLFWSGIFGDLTIFAAVLAHYFKHNCHVKGCLRLGKHTVDGSPYCSKHKIIV